MIDVCAGEKVETKSGNFVSTFLLMDGYLILGSHRV